ncbi:M23 family metallopeptidase [Desulfatibacillum aliphaticivorans]|uniref:M23 family metallopeptidase n=1 Tax=Desulfatibacillum aliphaticivorans TaxID=218208 RepID=UPI00040F6DAC|nr:M23 family metallopeptidase [Desulfatibacillum aliphaticivorans]
MKKKGFRFLGLLVGIALAVVLVPGGWYLFQRMEGNAPTVQWKAPITYAGLSTTFEGVLADPENGLSGVRIVLTRPGDKEVEVFSKEYPAKGFLGPGQVKKDSISFTIEPDKLNISDGEAVLRVSARDRSLRSWANGNLFYQEYPLTIDTRPPAISVLTTRHYLRQGGSGLAIYRLSEKGVKNGVQVGDNFFPGYSGGFSDPDVYMAFFAVDNEQPTDTKIMIQAADKAGNISAASFSYLINPGNFRKDVINISDRFMEMVLPQFEAGKRVDPNVPLIDRYLKINREQRQSDYAIAGAMCERSKPVIYWDGVFSRLPNSANRARFADRREYRYKGEKVDRQVHLGIDLASVAQSPVPAANSGMVIYAAPQGIYGQTVYIDHGFGLISQYSHLSRIDVSEGQKVEKDQIIGLTGSTGLAIGDHLHFGMLVGDTFVNPIEWWDASWIKNNVTSKINAVTKALQ